jgi:ankyrin repeat protein
MKMSSKIFDAVFKQDEEMLKELVSTGEDINSVDEDGRTPLIHSAIDELSEMVSLLLSHGADVTVHDGIGYTALHYAGQTYNADIAQLLLEKGANVDAKDSYGNTPLFRAVFNSRGRGEVIKQLLAFGADKSLKNNHDVSPYNLAKTIGNYNVVQFLD